LILYKINILAIYVNIPLYIYSTVTYLVNEQKKKKKKRGASFYLGVVPEEKENEEK